LNNFGFGHLLKLSDAATSPNLPRRGNSQDERRLRHTLPERWADIIPAHFDTYPLIDAEAAKQMLAAQVAVKE
jgi:hypothetical protein